MSLSTNSFRRRVAALTVALAMVLLAHGPAAFLQQLSPALEQAGHRDAVLAIAEFTNHRDLADQLLREAGFVPAVPGWRAFPSLRKIETAYLAAERAQPGQGSALLAALAKGVGREYAAALAHPALAPLASVAVPADGRFTYAPIDTVPDTWVPGPAARGQIHAISHYAEGVGLGGAQGILQHYFELPDARVYDILRRSNTTAEAIQRGLAYVPEAERNPRLAYLIHDVRQAYPNARHDARLLAAVDTRPPAREPALTVPASAGGAPPTPRRDTAPPRTWQPPSAVAGAGGAPRTITRTTAPVAGESSLPPAALARSVARYRGATRTWFPSAPAARFSAAVRVMGGPGGVMFGEPVTGDPQLAGLRTVTWLQPAGSLLGSLEFAFASGPPRIVGGLRADHVLAALRLLYSGIGTVPPVTEGDAIALVSLEDRIETPICDARGTRSRTEWGVIAHPAIADLQVGHDLLGADLLPTDTTLEHLLGMIQTRVGAADRQRLVDLFEALSPSTWKLTDVPLRVAAEGSKLAVRPAATTGAAAPSPAVALFTMQAYRGAGTHADERIEGFAAQFSPLVPALVQASSEYDSMNGFVRTLALLRWARAQGATVVGSPETEAVRPVPEAIHVLSDGYSPVRAPSSPEARISALLDEQLKRYKGAPVSEYSAAREQLEDAAEQAPRLDGSDAAWDKAQSAQLPAATRREFTILSTELRQAKAALDAATPDNRFEAMLAYAGARLELRTFRLEQFPGAAAELTAVPGGRAALAAVRRFEHQTPALRCLAEVQSMRDGMASR